MDERLFSQADSTREIERWTPSVCGLCSIGCGLEIGASGNEIVAVRGRAHWPVNRGRLGPKGLNQFYANRHPTRALHPMVRNGKGKLVRATWDEAMSAVVQKFQETLIEHGPDGVAFYNSGQLLLEEYYTLGKIARAGLGTANIDANTRLCTATTAASLMESFGADGPPGAYEDFDQTECIVLVGHNAAEQSTVLWMRILAAKNGPKQPKVIVIDPRRTFTVETGADLHLQLRPGTNVALLNGICNLLIRNGWIDEKFIARHTVHFDRFRKIVSKYTPALVEKITGVPQKQLRQAARWIGQSRSTVTTCLQGVYQSNQATASACIVNSMHLLMGKIGKPGSAPFQFAGQPSSMNTRETGADGTYPAYRNWEDLGHMRDLARLWNVPVELLGKKPVSAPEIFELVEKGFVKVLWVTCTNPAVSMTDRIRQLRAMAGTFLVVQDCFANTETAQFADVILPAAMWGEKSGCMTNAERRCSLLLAAVQPPGEARSDFDIYADFARRMNLCDRSGEPLIKYTDPEGAFNEWREISRGTIPDYSGMTYPKLRERGGIQWPCNDDHPDGATRLYTKPVFPTRWQISEVYEKDLETGHEHTQWEYRRKRDPKGRAVLIATDFHEPAEAPDREYPLTAISGRQVYHWHTRTKTMKSPVLREAAPGLFVSMNKADAKRLGIADGDIVRVSSRRASVEGPARVGDVVARGTVFIPFHYGQLDRSEAANNLMGKTHDAVSKQPVQKSAAVRVEKVRSADERTWW
ncbi:MAG TPA: nitrate reductase [Thermoanaerobaculia bacterium]|jgi:anaerobic selenocysteine-containing dehydrogenase|nr:nitrate reductase [Thermoanaerobaculia bacterium]